MNGRADKAEERVLVLLPTRKDAERTIRFFSGSGIVCEICDELPSLCREIETGAGAALLADELIAGDGKRNLIATLGNEPSWSSFPLIVVSRGSAPPLDLPSDFFRLITLVDRPVRVAMLRSVVETALRNRRRQYQNRDLLADLEAQARALQASEERYVAVNQDLTQAKAALERANRDLELRVHERTAKLQETIAELEAFSYSISHDLRAPLRAMQGYAEALLQDKSDTLDEESKYYAERIHRAASRLDLLTRDVLAYSRVAQSEVQLTTVSLEQTCREILNLYPDILAKGKVTVHSPLPSVLAHDGYLSQCISNLLVNAAKFAAPGVAPHIRIYAETESEWVRLWVEDDGIGIAPEHHEQIFQMFGRVYSESRFEGTGIGLTIVKKAVEKMGGSVGVTSELGKGSRFCLTLRKAS